MNKKKKRKIKLSLLIHSQRGSVSMGNSFILIIIVILVTMGFIFVGGAAPSTITSHASHTIMLVTPAQKQQPRNSLQMYTFSGITATPAQPTPTQAPPPNPCDPGSNGGFFLGAAVEPNNLDNPDFTAALKKYKFNSLTPENAMKFARLEPQQGQFNWADADKIVNFAQSNGMRVRGHNLAWHIEVPSWVNGLSNAAAEAALENHIKTVVGRYQGKIAEWDVVNEALNDDGTQRSDVWSQKIGPDYIAKAFQWAHEADPNAVLFYNDYGMEGIADRGGNKKAKSDAVYNMVKDFKARGIPIGGVGLQTHSAGDYPGTGPEIQANIQRLRALGVQVEITELDVINTGNQPARYAEIGTACKAAGCGGVTTWGLYDGHTWLSGQNPLLLDTNFQPKPAYPALMKAIGM